MLKQQTVQKLKKMNMQPMVDAATSVDDWLLSEEMKPGAVDELYAVVDARTRAKKSTIVCAQYRVEGWPKRMGDYPAAESIVDRLKNNAYKVELKGEISMRERCMDEELRAYAEQKKD